ncbi:hypothetical protein M422DRAFT_257702 [Sphaerobolus stellatus SS14]|uniref:Enolpyruvate transferase domain-containing protein n=1 Tax=Sphaerobolus stellatus (strain SS14) TaxID=990650 RepID=A0A0C9VNR6_SPHS4|nr:hypothetical protein M422DRAFT_257702 [Sphaerobolus stellatus SS14]
MVAALSDLKICLVGAKFSWEDNGETLVVEGSRGALETPESGKEIYLGNADTAARFLTTVCTLARSKSSKQTTAITGNARMKQRPIGPVVDGLRENGTSISYLESQGCLPLSITSGLKGGHVRLAASVSSQCLLYIGMTVAIMRAFGADIQREALKDIYHIKPIDKVVQVFFSALPVSTPTFVPGSPQTAVSLMEELSYDSDAIEVRVDLLSEDGNAKAHNVPSLGYVAAQVVALRRNTLLPIICTMRTVSQGGLFPDDGEEAALALMNLGIPMGCEYIDVEIDWSTKLQEAVKATKGASQLIAPWHD